INIIPYCFRSKERLDVLSALNLDIVNCNYYISAQYHRPPINNNNPITAFQACQLCRTSSFFRKNDKPTRLLQTKYLGNTRCDVTSLDSKPRLFLMSGIDIIE